MHPFREYHTNLDNPDLMDPGQMREMGALLRKVVEIFENIFGIWRSFYGLICLSNPQYDLYLEREDPAVAKKLPADLGMGLFARLSAALFRWFNDEFPHC